MIEVHRVPVMETCEEEVEVLDEDGQPAMVSSGECGTLPRPKIDPEYDESQEYIPREQCSEWDFVGLAGQLPLRKGQPSRAPVARGHDPASRRYSRPGEKRYD